MTDTNNPYESAITNLVAKIEERIKPIIEDQRMVNRLCALSGVPSRYPNAEAERASDPCSIRRDQFHGKPLATAVKRYFELRGPSDRGGLGAATVNEIYDTLIMGGYRADTADEENAKRGLRIALTKNSYMFYRVSSDQSEGGSTYGLLEWYPNAKPQKADDESQAKRTRGRPPKVKQNRRGRPPKAKANVVEMKAATDDEPAAASELRKPGATGRKPGRPRKTPERKEEPHVVHEPDHSDPVADVKAA